MKNNVTDRFLLQKIYDLYYDQFCLLDPSSPSRDSRNYVPIDCKLIGKELGLDPAIVFGRLYYHLDRKYRFKNENGSFVSLFYLKLGKDSHVIHFPLLSAVVAELEQDRTRYLIPVVISWMALLVSIATAITTK